MTFFLKGIFYIESELGQIPGCLEAIRGLKEEKKDLLLCPITADKDFMDYVSVDGILEQVGDFRRTCLFLGTSRESLAVARECQMAVLGVEALMIPRVELEGLEYVCDMTNPEDFDLEFFERIYRRQNGIPWDILETQRCFLRELCMEDLDDLFELYRHPEVTLFMEPLFEREKEEEYEQAYIENMYRFFEYGMWLVFDRESGRLIGRAGLENREYPEGNELELGYAFAPEYWGKGYATEVCAGILQYAKEHLDYSRINCLIQPENKRSIALAERLGFAFLEECSFTGETMKRFVLNLALS